MMVVMLIGLTIVQLVNSECANACNGRDYQYY